MDQDHQERIRQRAHEIWESEGRPEGRDADHWTRAEAELRNGTGDQQPGEGAEPKPARTTRAKSAKSPKATKAASSAEPAKPKRTRKSAMSNEAPDDPQAESTPYLNDGP